MARLHKAMITAVFGYGQSAIGMVLGFVVTRSILHLFGKDVWGLWAASGALLSYAGLADLGVLRILPRVIADANGQKDDERIRASLAAGLPYAVFTAFVYLGVAFILWHIYPSLLRLSPSDKSALRGPVLTVVILTACTFPLRVFTALLTGLQDATFLGVVGLVEAAGTPVLTLVLAWRGLGLYSLAVGVTLPPVCSAAAAVLRANISFRRLLRGWSRPKQWLVATLALEGIGAWLGTAGFQLASATDPVILSNAGLRSAVTGFVITSRLPTTLVHFVWILPDAALIGLAQLRAEGVGERTREIVLAILRLNLILAGVVACAVLAANAAFVRLWVGADLFFGAPLNGLLAANAVLITAIHGLIVISGILGSRLVVGTVFVVNGVLHVVLASFLCRYIGVYGVCVATLVSGSVTALPAGLRLLQSNTGLTPAVLWAQLYRPWLRRFAPLGAGAYLLGCLSTGMPLGLLALGCSGIGFAYLFAMKPLYVGLPLGHQIQRYLSKVRLVPRSDM